MAMFRWKIEKTANIYTRAAERRCLADEGGETAAPQDGVIRKQIALAAEKSG